MRMYGVGIALCGFCKRQVRYKVEGERIWTDQPEAAIAILRKADDISFYCTIACMRASSSGLFDEVLR